MKKQRVDDEEEEEPKPKKKKETKNIAREAIISEEYYPKHFQDGPGADTLTRVASNIRKNAPTPWDFAIQFAEMVAETEGIFFQVDRPAASAASPSRQAPCGVPAAGDAAAAAKRDPALEEEKTAVKRAIAIIEYSIASFLPDPYNVMEIGEPKQQYNTVQIALEEKREMPKLADMGFPKTCNNRYQWILDMAKRKGFAA